MITTIEAAVGGVSQSREDHRISVQQLAQLFNRLPTVIVTEMLFSSAVIVAMAWDAASARELIVWLAAHFAVVGLLGFVYLRFRNICTASDADVAGTSLQWSLFALGAFWGAFLIYTCTITPSYAFHFYVLMFVGSLGVLAIVILAEDLRCFLAFTSPLFLSVSVFALASGEGRRVGLGALGLLCFGTVILFARVRQRSTAESLRLRFEVVDLATELREQRDAAHAASVAKSRFFATASHDLRQPVHALTLLTSALQGGDLDATTRPVANDIAKAVDSLERLFDSLLDVSRLDAGIVSPRLRHFDLDKLIERVVDEMRPEARRRGLLLEYRPCQAVVCSDPVLLERILRNYLSNAVRYTNHGNVVIACQKQTAQLRIEVKDSGIGIPRDQHAAIFDEFHQVENSERDRSKGLGLGLAIVRRIAELLGHSYGVESDLGRGASFFVTVPIGEAAAIEREPLEAALAPASVAGLKVIIIDDDALVRNSTSTLLSLWQCDVVAAGSTDEALDLIRGANKRPDALLVDYRLRNGATGVQAIEAIRRQCSHDIPALILSGDTAPERLMEVAQSGLAMMHKPVQPAILRAFLSSARRQNRSDHMPAS